MKRIPKRLVRYGVLFIVLVVVLCSVSVMLRSCQPAELIDTVSPTATLPSLDELLGEDITADDVTQIPGVISRELIMLTHRPTELRYLCNETEQELVYTLAIEPFTNHPDLLVLHRVAGQWSDDQVIGYNASVVIRASCTGDPREVTQVGELRHGMYIAYNQPWHEE